MVTVHAMPRVEIVTRVMLRSGGRTEVPAAGGVNTLHPFDEVDRVRRR